MTRILVVWEDEQFSTLNTFVKRRLSAKKPEGQPVFPVVLFHTSRGNGRFAPYVRETWTNTRQRGLPSDAGAIDHLVCVVDGDKLHNLLKSVANPASHPDIPAWHRGAMAAWQAHLDQSIDPAVPRGTVHGYVLRWCKESLALAGYDLPPCVEHLGLDPEHSALRAYLAACQPDPSGVDAAQFSDHYRKPLRCLDDAQKALGLRGDIKNAPEIDDALKALAQAHTTAVCARVPDIDGIVDLLWRLSTPGAPAPPPAAAPPATRPAPARGAKAPARTPRKAPAKR